MSASANITNTTPIALVGAGLVLATSMAWADVFKSSAEYLYPHSSGSKLSAQLVYAIIITLILILVYYFAKTAIRQVQRVKKIIGNKIPNAVVNGLTEQVPTSAQPYT